MDDSNNDWAPCEAGELTNLGVKLRNSAAKTRQAVLLHRGTIAVAGLLLIGFIGWLANGPAKPGGISCAACYAGFKGYNGYLTGKSLMDAETVTQMAGHLDGCPHCRNAFEQTYPGVLAAAAKTAGVGLGSALLFTLASQSRTARRR